MHVLMGHPILNTLHGGSRCKCSEGGSNAKDSKGGISRWCSNYIMNLDVGLTSRKDSLLHKASPSSVALLMGRLFYNYISVLRMGLL